MDRSPLIAQLKSLKNRMDSIFDQNFRNRDDVDPVEAETVVVWTPQVDILEAEDHWFLVADLPGVREEDIEVEALGREIRIAGSRSLLVDSQEAKPLQLERPLGSFSRTFQLPADARPEKISAKLARGVLTVTIPRGGESFRPHKVCINAEPPKAGS